MSQNNIQEKLLEQELKVVKTFVSDYELFIFVLNRFALVEHRNCIDAQRNLSAFLTSPPSAGIFSGVQVSYAQEKKIKSKPISSSLAGEFQIGIDQFRLSRFSILEIDRYCCELKSELID